MKQTRGIKKRAECITFPLSIKDQCDDLPDFVDKDGFCIVDMPGDLNV
jgi:hypothetical protein